MMQDRAIDVIRELPAKQCATDLLKDNVDVLAPFITELFNRSLSSGVFPTQFKAAYITPLLKKSRIWTLLMGSHTGPYQTSLFGRRFLSDSLLVNSSDISVSGSCCLNCSQRTAPITQLRLQYFESLATFSKLFASSYFLIILT